MKRFAVSIIAVLATGLPLAAADLPEELIGEVVSFVREDHARLLWVTDMNSPYQAEGRAYLIDPDAGRFLGMLNLGYWTNGMQLPATGNKIVATETHFSRTTRGHRTDVVVSYDATSLQPLSEIEIPAKRVSSVKMQGTSALSDDARFLAQMNFTPAQSVSFVNLDTGTFIAEVDVPGCGNVYSGGDRAFHLLCGDGSFLTLKINQAGVVTERLRSAPLFDPFVDPITISGVRKDDKWYFVTLGGSLLELGMSEEGVNLIRTWPLISNDEKDDDWSIAGFQHLALHAPSNRLYLLTLQGPPEAFEDPGTAVWVFDLETRTKIDGFELEEMSISIAISQDADPLLYAIGAHIPMPFLAQLWIYATEGEAPLAEVVQLGLDIYQADDGTYLRSVPRLGNAPTYIQPW